MNDAEKQAVLHCLKAMIDEEVCEECPLYGTTGTDHCEKDCVRLAINALSSAENPNKWIPVSERLPEEHGGYLVTVKYGYVTRALWVGDAENWKGVIAWMPLPEPYKQEVEG